MLRFAFELLATAGLLGVAWLALRSASAGPLRYRQFSLASGAGALFLAVDEALNLHERLGRVLYARGWNEPAGINHFDDLLLMGIAAAGLGVAAWFAAEIRRDRLFARLFVAGVFLFAAAIAWDAVADPTRTLSWWLEESFELAGVAAMLWAFSYRARARSRHAIEPVPAPATLSAVDSEL